MPGPGVKSEGRAALPTHWSLRCDDYVVALAVSPSGDSVAVGTGGGQVLVADARTGEVRSRTEAHPMGVLELAFSADGRHLATCGQDRRVKLFGPSGELEGELEGHASWVEHVAWDPSTEHRSAVRHDPEARGLRRRVGPDRAECGVLPTDPASARLALASGRRVSVWTPGGEQIFVSPELPSTVTAIAWRRDGRQLAATCYGGVHLFAPASERSAGHLAWKGSLLSVAWSPDGKVIACGSQDGSVHFWRLASGEDSEMRGYASKPKALAWDGQSKLLATAGDAKVTVWRFEGRGPEGTRPILLEGHQGLCTQLAFSPRRGTLASASQDSSILLWEPRKSERPTRYAFLEASVTALGWGPDHRALFAADAVGNVAAWALS